MNSKMTSPRTALPRASARLKGVLLSLVLSLPVTAHASIFHGETLDKVADVMTWVVLVVAPVVAIGVFLLIHILPEKIAEKKQHPQTHAIQCLCLLSLFFGGMLWPLAWLWAYSKPVMYKLAYGTDKVALHEPETQTAPELTDVKKEAVRNDDAAELHQLRARIAELETKLAGTAAADTRKA
jgi:CBS domain containing-hemolysin-like protein